MREREKLDFYALMRLRFLISIGRGDRNHLERDGDCDRREREKERDWRKERALKLTLNCVENGLRPEDYAKFAL